MLCWEKSSTFCVQGIDIAPAVIPKTSKTAPQNSAQKPEKLREK